MDDFVFISVLITVCFLEVFFIVEDILGLKSFYVQRPSKNKSIKYFGLGFLRILLFLAIVFFSSFLLNLIPYLYYWGGRNMALIEALKPELNSRLNLLHFVFYFFFPVSLVYIAIVKIIKKKIALSIVFPMIAFCGFALLMVVLFDYEYKYYRNPLADTRVSSSFKPLNVPELKEGMSKNDVLELLGDPLEKLEDEFVYAKRNGIGWYEYLCLDVYFENDIVKKIDKRWKYED